jgi:excisionase family DNA binding protein
MRTLKIDETYNDHLTENEERQLEEGLRILARIIARKMLKERSLPDGSPCKESSDSPMHSYQGTTAEKLGESLAVSVREAAKMLGLSRASAYEAVRTGQIPSLRFGKRIVVPRVALNRMLSQADDHKSQTRY